MSGGKPSLSWSWRESSSHEKLHLPVSESLLDWRGNVLATMIFLSRGEEVTSEEPEMIPGTVMTRGREVSS